MKKGSDFTPYLKLSGTDYTVFWALSREFDSNSGFFNSTIHRSFRLIAYIRCFYGEFVRGDNYKIEDRILLRKAACEGCSESLAMIYGKYRQMVCDFLHKIGAGGMAEDICQEVDQRQSFLPSGDN